MIYEFPEVSKPIRQGDIFTGLPRIDMSLKNVIIATQTDERIAELENLKDLRRGRLNKVADEHFRERIGEFYRRYPYDEWYPLDEQEMALYTKEYPGAKPFSWQQDNISCTGS